jgi:hypothetical protein
MKRAEHQVERVTDGLWNYAASTSRRATASRPVGTKGA